MASINVTPGRTFSACTAHRATSESRRRHDSIFLRNDRNLRSIGCGAVRAYMRLEAHIKCARGRHIGASIRLGIYGKGSSYHVRFAWPRYLQRARWRMFMYVIKEFASHLARLPVSLTRWQILVRATGFDRGLHRRNDCVVFVAWCATTLRLYNVVPGGLSRCKTRNTTRQIMPPRLLSVPWRPRVYQITWRGRHVNRDVPLAV